jgi:hypothetical protein
MTWIDLCSSCNGNPRLTGSTLCGDCLGDVPALALVPDILERFESAIVLAGVVGEEHIAKIEYLAITSRLLEKPVSIVVKGSSSSGKSYTTEKVCLFFPPKATLAFTGMSEKALILSSRSYAHRTIIVYEATALRERAERQSGDQTAYYLRSLVSEGQTHYEMSVRTKDGSWTTKRFDKKGPTNVIVTTTAVNLHNENETRMLSLQTNDTHAQTAAVLVALAEGTNTITDYEPWRALQEWLYNQKNVVVIPFARDIAENIRPIAVRLRRDFGSVLSLVKAHALLHQATRQRDEGGRIIATNADYLAVRDLALDVVSQGVGATVSATIRETVAAVSDLVAVHPGGVPASAVGRKLGLDPSAARRRLLAAGAADYVINQEERPSRPGRYVVGEPLPEDVPILPDLPTPSDDAAIVPTPDDGTLARGSEGVERTMR